VVLVVVEPPWLVLVVLVVPDVELLPTAPGLEPHPIAVAAPHASAAPNPAQRRVVMPVSLDPRSMLSRDAGLVPERSRSPSRQPPDPGFSRLPAG